MVEASRATSLEQQIDCVVNKVHEAMRAEVCSLYLSEAGKELVMLATVGLDRRVAGQLRLAMGEGLVGTIAARQLALRLEKASEHPAFHYFPESGEEAFEAFLGVPIVHLGRTLGVLVVQDRAPRVFDDEDEAFLYTVATQLAGSLLRWSKAPASQRAAVGVERRVIGLRGAPGVAVGKLHLVINELALAAIDEPGSDPEQRARAATRRGAPHARRPRQHATAARGERRRRRARRLRLLQADARRRRQAGGSRGAPDPEQVTRRPARCGARWRSAPISSRPSTIPTSEPAPRTSTISATGSSVRSRVTAPR